jgi:hypothetical protein
MKRIAKILAAVAGFLLGSATVVSAGVVMTETAIASGPVGNGVQHRTIYVQGNKQKVDTDDVQTITDLDKRLLYVVDKTHKNYVEMPLASLSGALPSNGGPASAAIELKRTGAKQVIADQKCDEYRGREGNDQLEVAVSACVSTSAPGAQEIARFDRKMLSQMRGLQPKPSSEESAGVVLEKKSVVNLRVADLSQQRYRMASVTTKTTVNDIRVKRLAAQTFQPPKGYSKVENQPREELPDDMESTRLEQPLSSWRGPLGSRA